VGILPDLARDDEVLAGCRRLFLDDVLAWELGEPGLCPVSGLSVADAARCYMKALSWAVDVCAVLGAPA
jgi:hypothetical protein